MRESLARMSDPWVPWVRLRNTQIELPWSKRVLPIPCQPMGWLMLLMCLAVFAALTEIGNRELWCKTTWWVMSNDESDPNGNLLWVLPQREKRPGVTQGHLNHESKNSIELAMSPLVEWSMMVPSTIRGDLEAELLLSFLKRNQQDLTCQERIAIEM